MRQVVCGGITTCRQDADTFMALQAIARYPAYKPERVFGLVDEFYPVPTGWQLRATPFMPYLVYAPSAWIIGLKFSGGGLNAPGKIMFDSAVSR